MEPTGGTQHAPAGTSTLRRSAWLVFAGALIVFLGFEINGFDLINDAIGAALVVAGLWNLRGSGPTGRWLTPATAAATVWFALTVALQLAAVPWPVIALHGASGLVATILSVLVFREACRRSGLDAPASSWSTSLRLIVSIWGGFALVGAVAWAASGGREVHYETLWVIPLIILAFVPFIHLLVSLVRTASAARS